MLNPKDSMAHAESCILKINNIGWCIGVSRKCAASSRRGAPLPAFFELPCHDHLGLLRFTNAFQQKEKQCGIILNLPLLSNLPLFGIKPTIENYNAIKPTILTGLCHFLVILGILLALHTGLPHYL